MITLTKNGKYKTIGRKSFKTLKGNLDGWKVVEAQEPLKERKIFTKPKQEEPKQEVKQETSDEPTREQMIDYLTEKGHKPHPKLGDEKLRKRYELEIETDQS